MQAPNRSPEEIRDSIDRTRRELVRSIDELRGGVQALTDWRRQVRENKKTVLLGAAVVGFVIGGGAAAFSKGLFGRRRY